MKSSPRHRRPGPAPLRTLSAAAGVAAVGVTALGFTVQGQSGGQADAAVAEVPVQPVAWGAQAHGTEQKSSIEAQSSRAGDLADAEAREKAAAEDEAERRAAAARTAAEEKRKAEAAQKKKEAREKAAREKAAQEREKKTAADRTERREAAPVAKSSTPTGSPRQIARQIIGDAAQFQCFSSIVERESGWDPHASNSSSGAYGLVQALPGSKMASAGSDWRTNPATQIKWGLNYMNDRYDSPCGAWEFWQANNWY